MTEAMIDRRNLLATGALMTVGAAALSPITASAAATAAALPATSGYTPQPVHTLVQAGKRAQDQNWCRLADFPEDFDDRHTVRFVG